MAQAVINGVRLYYEATGRGFPLVLCHELAANCHSWDEQVRFFSRRYQVIVYNAKGYPPSEVPDDVALYEQDAQVADLHGLLRHLNIEQAYVGGLSMGGTVALNFGVAHPEMTRALIVAGTGTGSTDPGPYRQQVEQFARGLDIHGMAALADYAKGPTRVQFMRKDRKGWEHFNRVISQFSAKGCALTLRGFPGRRPTVFELESKLRRLSMPVLIMCGDEDDPCIETSIFMKKVIPKAGLAFFPRTGHTLNLEEPDLFNRCAQEFLQAVEAGHWDEREAGSGVGFIAAPDILTVPKP
jgi:pimeloyl-ACP methyl ester carboxylesterase